MIGWLNTFYRGALDVLPEDLRNITVEDTAALLAPVLRAHDGRWTADYVRLRFIAKGRDDSPFIEAWRFNCDLSKSAKSCKW